MEYQAYLYLDNNYHGIYQAYLYLDNNYRGIPSCWPFDPADRDRVHVAMIDPLHVYIVSLCM